MAAPNVALVAEIIDAFNARDVDRILELTDPDEFELDFSAYEYIEVRDSVVMVGDFRVRGKGSGVEVAARGAQLYEFNDGSLVAMRQFQSKGEALAAAGE